MLSLFDDAAGTVTTTVVVAVVVSCTTDCADGVGVDVIESLSHGSSSSGGRLGDGVDEIVLCAMAEMSIHGQHAENIAS